MAKITIGVTGQSGFIGTHLYNYLGLKTDVRRIPFFDSYFEEKQKLGEFVKGCDVIVHLAALNRNDDPDELYNTNIRLVERLIDAIESQNRKIHVVFASSMQEVNDTAYGRSKLAGRKLFDKWASETGNRFTGLIIPNVFGPFGKPFYNSVIATFCYQLTHQEEPQIRTDAKLGFISVNNLVEYIHNVAVDRIRGNPLYVPYDSEISVSGVLEILHGYVKAYLLENIIPSLKDKFEVDLFNTFRSYIDFTKHYPVYLKLITDQRGHLFELLKEHTGGQVFCSLTHPGVTRGEHFHIHKIERFCVIEGRAQIKLRRIGTKEIRVLTVCGDRPCVIDMPVWFTHNIANIGDSELLTIFWSNEFFDPRDPDTFYERVEV